MSVCQMRSRFPTSKESARETVNATALCSMASLLLATLGFGGLRLRSVWGAAAAVAEYAPRCYRACFLNIFSVQQLPCLLLCAATAVQQLPCLLLCLLGKRFRNCQLTVLPVRRRAGQAIFDCSHECCGVPLVGSARATDQEPADSTHKQAIV